MAHSGEPRFWTWVLGTLMVLAIFLIVFGMLSRTRGSTNRTLPDAARAGSADVLGLC